MPFNAAGRIGLQFSDRLRDRNTITSDFYPVIGNGVVSLFLPDQSVVMPVVIVATFCVNTGYGGSFQLYHLC